MVQISDRCMFFWQNDFLGFMPPRSPPNSTFIFRTRVQVQKRKPTGFRLPKGLQSLHAPLCSEVRSADRQMESAAGHESPGGPAFGDAVKASRSADVPEYYRFACEVGVDFAIDPAHRHPGITADLAPFGVTRKGAK